MIKDLTIGQYIPGSSMLHRADPRVKILLAIAFMVLTFTVDSYLGFLALGSFTLLTIISSGVPLWYCLKGLKPILFILVFAAVINLFTIKGEPVSSLPVLSFISKEGIHTTFIMICKLSLLVMGMSMLTLTTTPISLTDGIEKLMTPLKRVGVPAHEIAMMMTIALRFIPTLLAETDKIMKAQSARGADFDTGNLVDRAKSFVPVLVPLFISAFRRADELAIAMESRCYRGSEGRTRMKQLRLSHIDLILSFIMVVFTAGVLFTEYAHLLHI